MVPLGGHPAPGAAHAASASPASAPASTTPASPGASATPASPVPATASTPGDSDAAIDGSVPDEGSARSEVPASDVAPGIEDLLEVWPDLLDELLESDRAAWNAVRQVQPLALDGEVFTFGVASVSDLNAFKSNGAGPLREAISSAIGMTIKFMPKPLPDGVRSAYAGREGDDSPAEEPSPTAETALPSKTPTKAPQNEQSAGALQAQSSNAPTIGAPIPPTPAEPPRDEYPEPIEAPEPDPGYEPEPEPVYAPEPADEAELKPEPAQAAAPTTPAPTVPPKRSEPPGFTRYGESVVREVLGARFIEERPLPEGFER